MSCQFLQCRADTAYCMVGAGLLPYIGATNSNARLWRVEKVN